LQATETTQADEVGSARPGADEIDSRSHGGILP
jgi:hypothetical protein